MKYFVYFWPFIIQFYPTATCFLKTSSYFETSLCFKCDGTSQPHHCQQIHLHLLKKSRITSLWILDFIHLPVDFRWFFVKWLAKPCMNIFLAKLSCTIGTICSDTHPQTLNFKFQNNNFFGNTALQNCNGTLCPELFFINFLMMPKSTQTEWICVSFTTEKPRRRYVRIQTDTRSQWPL